MVPRSLLVLVVVAITSLFHAGDVEGVRLCGRRLADLLNFVCEKHGGFHAPRARRDVSDKAVSKRAIVEILRPINRRTENDLEPRGGVVDECCRKQCTMATLLSYCANSKHAGNIDLEEMLPPGSENTAISAEDIADYQQLQHESKSKAESAELPYSRHHFSHSNRPNLGQFMRSRPVFMVLSQLQEDEDRALGDYRF